MAKDISAKLPVDFNIELRRLIAKYLGDPLDAS
jgi:hypothetical protein